MGLIPWSDIEKVDIGLTPINWDRLDVLIARSIYTEEEIYAQIGNLKYEEEILDITRKLSDNQKQDDSGHRTLSRLVARKTGNIPKGTGPRVKCIYQDGTKQIFSEILMASVAFRMSPQRLKKLFSGSSQPDRFGYYRLKTIKGWVRVKIIP